MKQSRILVAMMAAALGSTAVAETFDARGMARGGTGVAQGDEFRSAARNPSLLATGKSNDWVGADLSFGALISDRDDLADAISDAEEAMSDFEDKAATTSATPADANRVKAAFQAASGRPVRFDAGLQLAVAIPTDVIAAALIIGNETMASLEFQYDSADDAYFDTQGGTGGATYDSANVASTVNVDGYGISEAGLAFGKTVDVGGIELPKYGPLFIGSVDLGATVKYQQINIIQARVAASNDNYDDTEETYTDINIDVGAHKTFLQDRLNAGIVIKNLLGHSYDTPLGDSLDIDPTVTAGATWDSGWNRSSAELDLTTSPELGQIEGSQFLRVGTEFRVWDHAQVRLGYRHDLKGDVKDIATLGLGVSPFGLVNLDLTVMAGADEGTAGVVLQIGAAF